MPPQLTAPFPWYGGKRRWADTVIKRLGPIEVYVEPFAGSLAVLLSAAPRAREIVCDTDGMICNAWRAIREVPDQVAYWADYPTFHQDLTARRHWLTRWRDENASKLSLDPDYYDAQAAGWWVWCVSIWIGGPAEILDRQDDNQESISMRNGRPRVNTDNGGRGISAQRRNLRDLMPYVERAANDRGITAQQLTLPENAWQGRVGDGTRLYPWMFALAQRLAGVVVLNSDWQSAVTPTLLQHTSTSAKPHVGIFLDPPYRTENRMIDAYQSDLKGASNHAATQSYLWAVKYGSAYRIAYCCRENDFPVPEGWDAQTMSFGAIHDPERKTNTRDLVMFSPACMPREQLSMF